MIRTDLHESLKSACRLAIQHGNTIQDIKADKWSETYGNCGTEHVRAMFEHELTKLSREPQNAYEEPAE